VIILLHHHSSRNVVCYAIVLLPPQSSETQSCYAQTEGGRAMQPAIRALVESDNRRLEQAGVVREAAESLRMD
jgi:hypothetical protein